MTTSITTAEIELPFVTDGRTIINADIVNFAGFSGDYGPYHVDHTVGGGVFGRPILHGIATLSICSGLIVQSRFLKQNGSDPVALLDLDVKLRGPVLVGDTVRASIHDLTQRPSASRPDHYVCVLEIDCLNNSGEAVLQIVWTSLQHRPLVQTPAERGST